MILIILRNESRNDQLKILEETEMKVFLGVCIRGILAKKKKISCVHLCFKNLKKKPFLTVLLSKKTINYDINDFTISRLS